MDFSLTFAALGENDSAFVYLENALVNHAGYLVIINEPPRYDRMRPDSRFAPLVRSLGLRANSVTEVAGGAPGLR